MSNYYPKISNELLMGAAKVFEENGLKNHKKIFVPGIFEIPVIIAKNIDFFDAFVLCFLELRPRVDLHIIVNPVAK